GSEGNGRVAVRDEPALDVSGQRADRADAGVARAGRCRRAARRTGRRAETGPSGVAGVGRLRPRRAAVEREVDPADAYTRGERARRRIARVAGVHVDGFF